MTKILISNDDGIDADGISFLAKAMANLDADFKVVAPDRDRSGASNSLTLDNPIRTRLTKPNWHRVGGTPTDCVHLALTGLLPDKPDMVVSGINHGANLGDDVLYSGTVAAAMEGRFMGLPAIAFSLATKGHVGGQPTVTPSAYHFDTAQKVAEIIVQGVLQYPLKKDTILNVNVPDLPVNEIKGFQTTRLGHRHKAESMIAERDPRGRPIFWIGPVGEEEDAGEGTDFHAIHNGYVSITPIHTDLTHFSQIDETKVWSEKLPRLI